jgi:hypothetical protein
MNGGRQMLGTSKMKLKNEVISIYLMRSKRMMTEQEEEKITLKIPYKYFLHVLHAVPIYCPQNTHLQRSTELFFMQFLFAITQQE